MLKLTSLPLATVVKIAPDGGLANTPTESTAPHSEAQRRRVPEHVCSYLFLLTRCERNSVGGYAGPGGCKPGYKQRSDQRARGKCARLRSPRADALVKSARVTTKVPREAGKLRETGLRCKLVSSWIPNTSRGSRT